MTLTVTYLQAQFDKYNKLFFDGILPHIPIKLSRTRDTLGQFTWTYDRLDPNTTWDEHIKISTYYDLPKQEVLDTLVHEMIHYYIHFMRIPDTGVHGEVFMGMARDINSKSNFHISATADLAPESLKLTYANKIYRILKFTDTRGRLCYGRISKNFNYEYMIKKYNMKGAEVFESKDTIFDNWKEGRTNLRYYFGDEITVSVKKAMKKTIYRNLTNKKGTLLGSFYSLYNILELLS